MLNYSVLLIIITLILGIFYYMLGNVSPQFRSSLKSIQLVSILKASLIQKYGVNSVLQPFMDEILALEKVCNYSNTIHVRYMYAIIINGRMKVLIL